MKTRLNLRWAVVCEGLTVAAFAWEWQARGYMDRERQNAGDWQATQGRAFGHQLSLRDRAKAKAERTRRRSS